VRSRPLALLAVTALGLGLTSLAGPAKAAGTGTPYLVSVGDSYISGEAGRWAGNDNQSAGPMDALGSAAYFDNATHTAEAITRCHRSSNAEVNIASVSAVNLACSGAQTATFTDGDGNFKPGLDFYSSGSNQGQALALQTFANTHNVKAVVVSIGGNDFGFAGVVQSCVTDFLGSPTWYKDYCNDDSSVTAQFTSANVSAVTTRIKNGLLNLRTAMRGAGYADGAWSLVVQTYESPIPNGTAFRYGESGYGRQSTGGCGFWNNDANWANATALPTINAAVKNAAAQAGIASTKVLDVASAFNGRRLCENTVGLIEEKGLASWQSPGAVDQTEWVNQIRTVSTANSDFYIQESLHPNYWGQQALSNCLRQAWNGGTVKGGVCTRGANGLNSYGEPNMLLS
jgi:hypothetical protein